MQIILSSNTYITLTSNITESQTTIPVSSITSLPSIDASKNEYFYLDIVDEAGAYETLKITSISGLNLISVRAQGGTIAKAFNTGSPCGLRIGKAVIDDLITEIDSKLALAGGTLTNYLTLHANPEQAFHAVTKQYVDNLKSGLDPKDSVRAATVTNITLSGQQTVDGVNLRAGDRILVKNQTNATLNGIYNVATNAWTRSEDANANSKINPGLYVFVEEGTINNNSGWLLTTSGDIDVGTTNLAFVQFTGLGQVDAGDGLVKIGNQLNIATASSSRLVINTDNIDLAVTNITPGDYTKLTIDAYGRATAGTTPTTLSGYSINDASGILTQIKTVDGVGSGLDADLLDGYEGSYYLNASNLNNGTLPVERLPDFTGDLFSTPGSNSLTLNNSGITTGSYTKVTVNAKGLAVNGSNPTTLSGYNISDAAGILSQLLNVDGAASGLDADKLDGYDSSSFARLSNNETITGQWTISNSTVSNSHTSGALVISGGLGVGGNTNINGNLTVNGDFTINGSTSIINSTTINVDDKNLELGNTNIPTDSTADGGGITLKGTTDKTIIWDINSSNWTSSENWNLASGKAYKINNTSVLSATTLGSSVVNSSLTSVGTLTSLTTSGQITSTLAIGTAPFNVTSTTVNANLNADLLDGQHGSYYTNATNLLSGTVSSARLGSGTASSSTYLRGDNTWVTLDKTSVGLGNIENTSLSTWTGSSNITSLGTIGSGTWQGTAIASSYISSTLSNKTLASPTVTSGINLDSIAFNTTASLTTTATTANQVLSSLSISSYRSIKAFIQATSGSFYHSTEVNLIHDGTSVYINEVGTMYTGSSLISVDADINSGNIRILVTPVNASTAIKTAITAIMV